MKFYAPIKLGKLLEACSSHGLSYQVIGDSDVEVAGMNDYQVVLPGALVSNKNGRVNYLIK